MASGINKCGREKQILKPSTLDNRMANNHRKVLALAIVLILLGFFIAYMFSFKEPQQTNSTTTAANNLLVIHGKGNDVTINVEYATTPVEQAQGLMFRQSLNQSSGMLFVFQGDDMRTFWMKNTLIPLDMIFIAQNMTIVNIAKDAMPCVQDPCHVYDSGRPARYVLEVNGGFADLQNIAPGDTVSVTLP
jgi:uncharacterized protein